MVVAQSIKRSRLKTATTSNKTSASRIRSAGDPGTRGSKRAGTGGPNQKATPSKPKAERPLRESASSEGRKYSDEEFGYSSQKPMVKSADHGEKKPRTAKAQRVPNAKDSREEGPKWVKARGGQSINKSLAAERAWLGWDWLRGLESDPERRMLCTIEVAGAVKIAMNRHDADLPLACVWLSLLSFCGSPDDVDWLEKAYPDWRPPTLSALPKILIRFCKHTTSRITVYVCKQARDKTWFVRREATYGQGDRQKCLVIVEPVEKGGPFHALPFVRPADDRCVEGLLPPVQSLEESDSETASSCSHSTSSTKSGKGAKNSVPTVQLGKAEGSPKDDKVPDQASSSNSTSVVPVCIPEAPKMPVNSASAVPEKSPEAQKTNRAEAPSCVAASTFGTELYEGYQVYRPGQPPCPFPTRRYVADASEGHTSASGGARRSPAASSPTPPEGYLSYERPTSGVKGDYRGVYPPPPGYLWLSGWWASTFQGRPPAKDAILKSVAIPELCSATLGLAAQYRDRCHYLPVPRVRPHFDWKLSQSTITDGIEVEQWFGEGDVVVIDGSHYSVKSSNLDGLETLELHYAKGDLVDDLVWSAFGGIKARFGGVPEARVLRCKPPVLEPKDMECAKWTLAVHTQSNPTGVAMLNRMKQTEAENKFDGKVQAEDATRWVNALLRSHPSAQGVAGRYAWGYCFSCGKSEPGKYKQKLCKECQAGKNSQLADMVAEGHSVCSRAVPIVYPGVVNTVSRHPGLKLNTETIASGSNFRSAPSRLRNCSRKPRYLEEDRD